MKMSLELKESITETIINKYERLEIYVQKKIIKFHLMLVDLYYKYQLKREDKIALKVDVKMEIEDIKSFSIRQSI